MNNDLFSELRDELERFDNITTTEQPLIKSYGNIIAFPKSSKSVDYAILRDAYWGLMRSQITAIILLKHGEDQKAFNILGKPMSRLTAEQILNG